MTLTGDDTVPPEGYSLHVVANSSCRFTLRLHGACVGIGQRDLRVFCIRKLLLSRFHALNFSFQPANFIFAG